jgi:hypothetical protein
MNALLAKFEKEINWGAINLITIFSKQFSFDLSRSNLLSLLQILNWKVVTYEWRSPVMFTPASGSNTS